MYQHLTERTQPNVLPQLEIHKITLQTTEKSGHIAYNAQFWSEQGKCYELKLLPIYRKGTTSLMDFAGSVRIEICEIRKDDWMLYRLAYTNLVECKHDLAKNVAQEIRNALEQINVIAALAPLQIEFRENGIQRSFHAF
ncbi:hypothetical protein LHO91_003532 [Vibrio cholerae]|nr:hypothetical protein [Vibrio cholerae]